MKEHPILFSKPMILALLAGTKTQTRRIIKARKDRDVGCELAPHELAGEVNGGNYRNAPWAPEETLWAREAIRLVPDQEPDDGTGPVLSIYDADGSLTPADAWPWKRNFLPPMHCPRGLSRFDLEITSLRAERLQSISEVDAQSEGCDAIPWAPTGGVADDLIDWPLKDEEHPYRNGYALLWEQIHGLGSWAANPWVFVLAFRRLP